MYVMSEVLLDIAFPPTLRTKRFRFEEGLRRLGYDPETIVTTWVYVGGCCSHRIAQQALETGRVLDTKPKCFARCNVHINYARIAYPFQRRKRPCVVQRCVCGTKITLNCWIMDPAKEKLITIGSCCVKEFMNKAGRSCDVCGNLHNNRKDNVCNDCRKEHSDRLKEHSEELLKKNDGERWLNI